MGLPVRQWNSWLPGHDAAWVAWVAAHSNKGAVAIGDTGPVVVGCCRPTGPIVAVWRCHNGSIFTHSNKGAVAIGDTVRVVVGGGRPAGPLDAVWRCHDGSRAAHSNKDAVAICDTFPGVVGG
mmetsp:Transcript_35517/g.39913  ORF Transcript_35517/g.39913 Transcript_35517/m.39913 type:complete len:123 (+) Transcript_35517:133-501(+)